MLSNCNFFLGNEGGARHIAQALGIPSFALFSPHARKVTCLPSPSINNEDIEIEDVWNKLDYLMKQHGFS